MNLSKHLWQIAGSDKFQALPILSFPAIQKLNVTVAQLVKDPVLLSDVMAYIAAQTDTIAAVTPMDLSVEAEAFGANVVIPTDEIPVVTGQLICGEEAANALQIPSLDQGRLSVCIETIRLAKQKIQDKPVLTGMIGPYSLAGRLMDVTEIMYICYDDPDVVHTVLRKATDFLIGYGKALKEAGADGMIMAEPLAGILSPDMAAEFSVPYVKQIIDALQDEDFAVVYHNCGNSVSSMLSDIFTLGAAAYHFGNAVDMEQVMSTAPDTCLCMGNVDPASVIAEGPAESVTAATEQLLHTCGNYKNFLPSSGCDIPAHAKWDNILAFFAAVARANKPM